MKKWLMPILAVFLIAGCNNGQSSESETDGMQKKKMI